MTAMSLTGMSRPFTVDDLETMPDDGRRYELIDGELLVSPAPGWPHGEASGSLYFFLRQACPREFRVFHAPFGVRPDRANEVQPDVLVARYTDLTEKFLPAAPVLAVEVISPTSRLHDANLKKAFYERLGVPRYWLVDPDRDEPALTVFALSADGAYERVAHVVGPQAYDADVPFAVRVVPSELVAGLRP